MTLFRKSGLLDEVDQVNIFRKLSDAIESIERDMVNNGNFIQQQ